MLELAGEPGASSCAGIAFGYRRLASWCRVAKVCNGFASRPPNRVPSVWFAPLDKGLL